MKKNHHNSKEKVPREWRTRWRIPWFWNICQVFKERRILWASSSGQRQFKSRFVACARRLVFREANPPGGIQGWSGAAGGADLKPRYIGPVATIAKIVVAAYWVPLLWNNISEKAACQGILTDVSDRRFEWQVSKNVGELPWFYNFVAYESHPPFQTDLT